MAIATITSIEYNQKLKGKFDGAYLHATTDAGKKVKEFVFQKSDMFHVLKNIGVGSVVDLKYVKTDAGFFNLKDIVPTGDKREAPQASQKQEGFVAKSNGGGGSFGNRYVDTQEYVNKKDKSIIKQTCLKSAVEIVSAMLSKDMYKKSVTSDFIVQEISSIANKFEAHILEVKALEILTSSIESLDTSDSVEYDESEF